MIRALQENLTRYESRFGPVLEAEPPRDSMERTEGSRTPLELAQEVSELGEDQALEGEPHRLRPSPEEKTNRPRATPPTARLIIAALPISARRAIGRAHRNRRVARSINAETAS